MATATRGFKLPGHVYLRDGESEATNEAQGTPVGSHLWGVTCGESPVGSHLWGVTCGESPVGKLQESN
ncbi:hypothetical protein EYF80_057466 [Liparis tanakae]|uniref:Uncharacterized protein n=1 Tax=Liparis tanakae TaxID=230148 RepID=A0A4Z2EU48_9TELE|nr:hypothetical protein EYF80_057466 [Liparis tanakae]